MSGLYSLQPHQMKPVIQTYTKPFPHLTVRNMYSEEELELIWKELDFFTNSSKLGDPSLYQGAHDSEGSPLSNAKAIVLDYVYSNRIYSNILNINRKLFTHGFLDAFSELETHLNYINRVNNDITKLRYYEHGEYYQPHTDYLFAGLALSYFHKEPKLFSGGELIFPGHDYKFGCFNNSMILIPGYIEHGVSPIITDELSCSGNSRYCMTQFLFFTP